MSLYGGKQKKFIRIKIYIYLDELDEKIRKLDKYYHDDDFEFRGIRNIQDLFKSSIDEDYYKPTLVKSGYNSNYIQYESIGDKILTVKEYLGLIEPYLANMINDYKSKSEWKIQLTAEINFTSLKPDSVLCIRKVITRKL